MEWVCKLFTEHSDTDSRGNFSVTSMAINRLVNSSGNNLTLDGDQQQVIGRNMSRNLLHTKSAVTTHNGSDQGFLTNEFIAYYKEASRNIMERAETEWGFIIVVTHIIIPILCIAGTIGNLLNLIILRRRVS